MSDQYQQIQAAALLKEIGWDDIAAHMFVRRPDIQSAANDAGQSLEKFIANEIVAGSFDLQPEEAAQGVDLSPESVDSQALGGDFGIAETREQTYGGAEDKTKNKFKILGYNGEKYYYFPYEKKQIVILTPSQHTIQNLLQIADLNFWRDNYGGRDGASDGKIALTASNELIKRATTVYGIFDESGQVRGCGAWLDKNRVILHCGDKLYVNGKEESIIDLKSKYTYVAAAKLLNPSPDVLSNAEAIKLRYLCEMPTWENKLSGSLLAGWLVIAQICAALEWRPHIWLTGQAESGKSTIMDKIIKRVVGDIALTFDGGTTEAAIRSMMKYDARPIIYDEAEKNKNVMEGVLALTRLASSGGRIGKFGQQQFTARFAACFSAIRPPIKEFADETRISLLTLKQNRKPTARQDYQNLLLAIDDTITPDFSAKLLARILLYMPILLKNITTFKKAANNVIKGARAADQIAPMLAGLFFLHGTGEVSIERAEDWIREQDWSFHTTISEDNDAVRCLQHLCTHTIRYNPNNGTPIDVTIGDLIDTCGGYKSEIRKDWSEKTLRNYSILVKDDGVIIGNRSQALEKAFKDTAWSVGWRSSFETIDGAVKLDKVYFSTGNEHRAVKIPMNMFRLSSNETAALFAEIDEEIIDV